MRVTPAARTAIEKETTRRTEGCFAMRNMTERIPLTEWQRLGVRRTDGAALPAADIKAGLVTTDTRSFLVYENYDAILRYNCAHYYALTVALLALMSAVVKPLTLSLKLTVTGMGEMLVGFDAAELNVTDGLVVSTTQMKVAGVLSELPAASIARRRHWTRASPWHPATPRRWR